ncbi:MAG TPA: hypothetical protein VFE91_04585 [Nitrososphaerales archaeon]|nr:hypothetical protein [Nitrososphaerales archaeon]
MDPPIKPWSPRHKYCKRHNYWYYSTQNVGEFWFDSCPMCENERKRGL